MPLAELIAMIRTDVQLGWKSIPGYRHRIEGRENEDAVFTSREHPFFDAVMIIADGMGGHPEPRLAAQTATAAARDLLFARECLDELAEHRVDAVALLRRAVHHANGRVRRLAAQAEPTPRSVASPASAPAWSDEKPPGCTLIIAVIAGGRLAVANIGDGSVFLFRDPRLLPIAGGEARRLGSRPEEFLGRTDRPEVEIVEDQAAEGDRVVLCTDGLTRYFASGNSEALLPAQGAARSESLERLRQVVGRTAADPQALASQLTADGRGELYDDDTTVVIADVGPAREAPDPLPRERPRRTEEQERMEAAPQQSISRVSTRRVGLPLSIASVLAAVVAVTLWHPWRRSPADNQPVFQPFAAPAVDLSSLPHGGVILIHRETGRIYVLRTRPVGTPAADEPITLNELRVAPGKKIQDTGNSYRLDTARGRLIGPTGHSFPVVVDGSTGVIEISQGGILRLTTQPTGLPVFIDGRAAGRTPVSASVQAGKHQIQVGGTSGRGGLWYSAVEIPPGPPVVLSLDFTTRKGGRVSHP
jgi:serine/threonine protein phosphatase PrpC